MAEYINKYANDAAIQAAVDGGELIKPYVAYDEAENRIDWNSKTIDYRSMPLTFEILSDGYINWIANNTAYTVTIEYSKNYGEWTNITSNTSGVHINVVTGDVVQFRGNNNTYASTTSRYNSFKNTTCNFNLKGNIASLINSTGYTEITAITSNYTFVHMFDNCRGLINADDLILSPIRLSQICYQSMFTNCSSLTTAPALPATTLAGYCYDSMFKGCTSLTTVPELPATTLANNCYDAMFQGCISLNYIKCLATNISATNCTNVWVQSVSSSGTFVTPSTTNWSTGNRGIPSGWTRVNSD